jgi:uncharacterized protein
MKLMSECHFEMAGRKFRVLVSGATGLIGTALVDSLSRPKALNLFRPEVVRLVRHKPLGSDEVEWDPYEMRIDLPSLEGFDAVVHLAGGCTSLVRPKR